MSPRKSVCNSNIIVKTRRSPWDAALRKGLCLLHGLRVNAGTGPGMQIGALFCALCEVELEQTVAGVHQHIASPRHKQVLLASSFSHGRESRCRRGSRSLTGMQEARERPNG